VIAKLLLALAFCASFAAAQQTTRFVAIEGHVLSIAKTGMPREVLYIPPVGFKLKYGTTDAILSPDQHWIAYIRDHNAWIVPSKQQKTSVGDAVKVSTQGIAGSGDLAPIDAYLVSFSDDSKSLMYSIAPGTVDTDQPGVRHPKARPADYGYFLYTISGAKTEKMQLPGNIRPHRLLTPEHLFITEVGDYGDQFGLLTAAGAKDDFFAFAKTCAQALECDLAQDGSAAACTSVKQGHSQIFHCGVANGSADAVSAAGTCLNEFRRPQLSPDGKHTAYIRTPGNCSSKSKELWIDATSIYSCADYREYAWIDDDRLAIRCGNSIAISDLHGRRLGVIAVKDAPPSEPDK